MAVSCRQSCLSRASHTPACANPSKTQPEQVFDGETRGKHATLLICSSELTSAGLTQPIREASFQADIPVMSPRKLYIFVIQKDVYRIKSSNTTCNSSLKKAPLRRTVAQSDKQIEQKTCLNRSSSSTPDINSRYVLSCQIACISASPWCCSFTFPIL